MTGPEAGLPTLAFVYDRHAVPDRARLDARLAACRAYAAEHGWQVAGVWVDVGDAALCDRERPALADLLHRMAQAARSGRTGVCLVHDWGRLSHEALPVASMRHQIALSGGWTQTTQGETRPQPPTATSIVTTSTTADNPPPAAATGRTR